MRSGSRFGRTTCLSGLMSLVLIATVLLNSCGAGEKLQVESPGGVNTFILEVSGEELKYHVEHRGKEVMSSSPLGISLADGRILGTGLQISGAESSVVNEPWEAAWGESKWYRNQYRETLVSLSGPDATELELEIRAYDDGVAFRYHVKDLAGNAEVIISDELTGFNLSEDADVWWIQAYHPNRYEQLYTKSRLSRIDTVHTPLTMRRDDGLHISIHEAGLRDYSSMQLAGTGGTALHCDLAPWSNGDKVRTSVPFSTPWRTIKITESAAELASSNLVLNCNEPMRSAAMDDPEPAKYVGVWWGMIIGKWTWKAGPRHGATTTRAKAYIDFAADNGLDEVLVEGISAGFESLFAGDTVITSFTETTEDFDLEEVQQYARSKGVRLQAYLETSASTANFLPQMEAAFAEMKALGMITAKIGHVGNLLDKREYHYGQFGVEYYRRVLEKAAEYGIAVNFHEPIKDTGERRTFPNMLTREGARGMEYNAWGNGGNPVNHEPTLAFTRLLESPMDFTPGIFDLLYENLDPDEDPFEVRLSLVDEGNGFSNVRYKGSESFWQNKAMTPEVHFRDGDTIYVWTITEKIKAGEWEWGISAHDLVTDNNNLWLLGELGRSNMKLRVGDDGSAEGDTELIIPDLGIDPAGTYSASEEDLEAVDMNTFGVTQRVNTTLAKQLACYVVIYSPLQMASDFIENYRDQPAFRFIRDVPVDWDSSIVINGEVGEYITVARRDKNSCDWYLGSLTDGSARDFRISLSFLEPGHQYEAEFYADAEDADWETNPLALDIGTLSVSDTYELKLAPGGGHAVRFRCLDE